MGDAALALLVGLFLAGLVAFRRARNVLTPEARRALPRESIRVRTRRAAMTSFTVARVAVGVAALVGVVWLTVRLFT